MGFLDIGCFLKHPMSLAEQSTTIQLSQGGVLHFSDTRGFKLSDVFGFNTIICFGIKIAFPFCY
jgi:hypothetical protein